MSGDWTYILTVALCAASISYTISVTSIFEWLRNLIEDYIGGKIEELIHCPYCLGHYVVLVIMFTTKGLRYHLMPISGNIVYDFLFTWFCIVCVLSLLHYFMNLAYKPIAENEGLRARLKAQKQRKNKQNYEVDNKRRQTHCGSIGQK